MDWTPLVAALAAFIALQGPAVANILISWSTRVRVDQASEKLQLVHDNTNSTLTELRLEVAALRALVAQQGETIVSLRAPPDPRT